MHFREFQSTVANAADPERGLLTLLGLGAHAGALLATHRRYLRDGLDASASAAIVSLKLGELYQEVALLAHEHDLDLDEIAYRNLIKIRQRAIDRQLPTVPEIPESSVDVSTYAQLAATTDEDAAAGVDPLGLAVPMLGLAGEAGTLLVAQKKEFRDRDPKSSDREFLIEELGDIIWYATTVAHHCDLELDAVLAAAVARVEQRRDERVALAQLPADLPALDAGEKATERFPRRLVIRFQQRSNAGRVVATMKLIYAEPNAFPNGPIDVGIPDKPQGFSVGKQLGAELTDNSRRVDDYRFHDAVHFGFLAVMGWSANMRALLALKRRSKPEVDEDEDGARAIFAEEGLAAVLAKRSLALQGFRTEQAVDDESIEMITTVLEDLEVSQMPAWLWRRAIAQGFTAMRQLAVGRGGFLDVNLDTRTLIYSKTNPIRREQQSSKP